MVHHLVKESIKTEKNILWHKIGWLGTSETLSYVTLIHSVISCIISGENSSMRNFFLSLCNYL